MSSSSNQTLSVKTLLQPEDKLEQSLLSNPCFQEGLLWGKPRFGHPEGKVIFHIVEVLENINKLSIDDCSRNILRKVALVHDTFKFREEQFSHPRTWNQNHAHMARHFFSEFSDDAQMLNLIEFHDIAYYAWRNIFLYQEEEKGYQKIESLKSIFKDNLQLYYLFFKCDTRTGDKNQAPLKWFEESIEGVDLVTF